MLTIVVGAQYGGEGKGKVAAYIAATRNIAIACRGGGPNSSHTVWLNRQEFRLRMLPTAAVVNAHTTVCFGPGTLIHIKTLFDEINQLDFKGKLLIDPKAGVITDEIIAEQRADPRYTEIGSTLTGTGYASALRCMRKLTLAAQYAELHQYLADVSHFLYSTLTTSPQTGILIEGHQGTGLSNYVGDYPYVSSRDASAAALQSEFGLGPNHPMNIVLVAKLFPTRNHQGHLPGELSEADQQQLGIQEFGGGSWGVQDRRRRVGTFDMTMLLQAIAVNTPNEIIFTGADYVDKNLKNQSNARDKRAILSYISNISKNLPERIKVQYVSTGPLTEAMLDLTT